MSKVFQDNLRESFKSKDSLLTLVKNIQLYYELERILKALSEVGIRPIILKGPALIEIIYNGDIAKRPFNDLDILIREKDWRVFKKVLLGLGYEISKEDSKRIRGKLIPSLSICHFYLVNSGKAMVDVHFDPLQLGLKMKTLEDLWATARKISIGKQEALVLSPEYQLLHLCVHANRHGYRKLIWLLDIYFLLKREGRSINWRKLQKITSIEALEAPVYLTLKLVHEVFSLKLDERIEVFKPPLLSKWAWEKTWPWEKVRNFQGAHDGSLVFMEKDLFSKRFFLNFILTRRYKDKIGYFARKLFPSKDYLKNRYGSFKSTEASYLSLLFLRYKDFFRKSLSAEVKNGS